MLSTDRTPFGLERMHTCWIPTGEDLPQDGGRWWKAVDGSGLRGYSQAAVLEPRWEPLELLMDMPGASAGARCDFFYVVETDIPPDSENDFNAWYEKEHLPGLSQVPGTVRARRYRRMQGGPRYMACYDLVTPASMESPAWLAVRNTPWSSRMRPLFRNARRTLHIAHTIP